MNANAYGIDLGTLSEDSGTINQTAKEQENPYNYLEGDFTPNQTTITPSWGKGTVNSDGFVT